MSGFVVDKRKIAIIGAGYVGASIAYALTLKDIAGEIVLIDINAEKTLGEAMDICHGIPSVGTVNMYAGDYCDIKDCNLIIITAGRGRRPGETRLDLAYENTKILFEVIQKIKLYYTQGVIMIVSNPVDVLTHKVAEWMSLPDGMVFGTGCILDTSRFVRNIADYVNISTGVVNAYVVGEHGDSQVPLWKEVSIGAIPIKEYCHALNIPWNDVIRQSIVNKTKNMGAEIIARKGKMHYGIATCVCFLADAIINHRPTIAPVCSPLQGEYGLTDVTLSVPSVISSAGVQQRIQEKWDKRELQQFTQAAEKIKSKIQLLSDI